MKEYQDERINEELKKSVERAIKDSEWETRSLSEWNILIEDIDKILEFVESDYTKEIYVNRNMWYILQDTFFNICDLYGVDILASDKVSEKELLIKKEESWLDIYIKNVCNFLNNTKGYITYNEIKFLLECILNNEFEYSISDKEIQELSDYVENDMQDEFLRKLKKMKNKIIMLEDIIWKLKN